MKNNPLKNWVVVAKPVKGTNGLIVRERYLMSKSRHKRTNIISLIGNANTTKKSLIKGEKYLLKQKIERRGGRPVSSFAMEFSFNLPPSVEPRPTPEEWRKIAIRCTKSIAEHLKLSPDDKREFYSQVRCVFHDQRNPHIHLILSKLVNGRVLHELQRKKTIAVAKTSFTVSVHRLCGLSIRNYSPNELNRGKRIDKWKYQRQKAEEAIVNAEEIVKIQVQVEKWLDAFSNANCRQMSRQINRISKSISKLSPNMRKHSSVVNAVSRVERLSGKKLLTKNEKNHQQ